MLDFGLAKADASGPEAGAASTLMTDQGAIVGTAPYMSPEQARGAPVDRRTDLWAFGCVLFEMLTGRRAFDGASHSDVLAGILERIRTGQPAAGHAAAAGRLIRRCLTKDSRRRFRDAGDARLELEDAASSPSGDRSTHRARRSGARPDADGGRHRVRARHAARWRVIAGWLRRPRRATLRSQVQFAVSLPDDERLAATELGEVAISPDGRSIVYVAGARHRNAVVDTQPRFGAVDAVARAR